MELLNFKLRREKRVIRFVILMVFVFRSVWSFSQNTNKFVKVKPVLNKKGERVMHTIEDHHGYIWMTHPKGISKYLGNDFINIELEDLFTDLNKNDIIIGIKKDYKNNLWITTKYARVAVCDTLGRITEFECFKNNKIQLVSPSKKAVFFGAKNGDVLKFNFNKKTLNKITSIPDIRPNVSEIMGVVAINDDELFISTDKGKLYKYVLSTKKLSPIRGPFSDYTDRLRIVLDHNKRLWVGGVLGLYVYDTVKNKFIQDTFFKAPLNNINKNKFISLFCDSSGNVWAGTNKGGLYRVDSNSGKNQLYIHHPTNKFSLETNTVGNINEDKHKNIWVVANSSSVCVLPNSNHKILYHEGSIDKTPTSVLSILKRSNNELWMGTSGKGIIKHKVNKKGVRNDTQFLNYKEGVRGINVQGLVEDDKNNVWIGTYQTGLWHYNNRLNAFSQIPIVNSLNHKAKDIEVVFKDSKNRIWVGSNLSLNVYSNTKTLLASFENNKHGLEGKYAQSIVEDREGKIWVGYFKGGLFKLEENYKHLEKSKFKNYSLYNEDTNKNNILSIEDMAVDNYNYLWLIDYNRMLLKFNTINYESRYFNVLNNEVLNTILIENKDHIWFGATDGIIHLSLKDSVINKYTNIDGFQGGTFIPKSKFKDEEGKLYFGGENGVSSFKTNELIKERSKAKLLVNSFEVLNQPAKALIKEQVLFDIEYLNQVVLKSEQSSFSFRFSAIDNILNNDYEYAYRLEGFNKDWIEVKKEPLATYTNIPSGNYTFQVKARSELGDWDIYSDKIKIEIKQPFWNCYGAYFIYICFFCVIVFGVFRWFTLRKKLEFEKILHKKDTELHLLKMDFFAKMSHEIQTSLTLIYGPIDDMIIRAKKNGNLLLEQRLKIIFNNVNRLSKIVFKLTTVRDKELNTLKLLVSENDLLKQLRQIEVSFREEARHKNIDFTINCPPKLSKAWYDKDKFEHIIYNLLSNAFKFTQKEGFVLVNIIPINENNTVKISIANSGISIPKEDLKNIFNLYFQSKKRTALKGAGIGLALTKELVELHRGNIKVKSSVAEGTVFSVTLPITQEAYLEEEKTIENINVLPEEEEAERIIKKNKGYLNSKSQKKVLIVEDNFELQNLLKELLSPLYHVILSEDGEEGGKLAKSEYPDIIISDIMMPKKDGIEMTKDLKKDHLTKHIPIVLLTAKNSIKSKITGLESGAIEFINKPFNTEELLLKINNIIKSTEHILTNYRKKIMSRPEVNIQKSKDDIFYEDLIGVLNSKIEDADFKIEDLTKMLNKSYSFIYRKCHEITGVGLVDLFRLLRLKKAAIVIAKYGYNVSEVAYVSGFNDPKYFSRCFKRHYGKSPNIFKNEALKVGPEAYLKKFNVHDEIRV